MPKTWVESAAHRLQCGIVNNKQNRVGQSEAHRDSAPVAPGGGAQREAHCGEDPHRDKLFGLGNKAPDEREIRDADETRELLLLVIAIQVGLALELSHLVHFRLRSRGSDRDPHVYRLARRSHSRPAGR